MLLQHALKRNDTVELKFYKQFIPAFLSFIVRKLSSEIHKMVQLRLFIA